MKKLPIYQVDAFTDKLFAGNPAAICPLQEWLANEVLQKIAAENNLSETAFYVPAKDGFDLRWFTPKTEVELCGHATLAAAYCLFNIECYRGRIVKFYTLYSGVLNVRKEGDRFILDLPADSYRQVDISSGLLKCFDRTPIEAYLGRTSYMLVYENETDIIDLRPSFVDIADLDVPEVIVTAKGSDVDFVSRFFAPALGINEDPVTGSAHTTLTPYWAARLGKTEMTAMQLSERKGHLKCRLIGDRVEISGQGTLYLKGEICLE